jgi:hypothetical protein
MIEGSRSGPVSLTNGSGWPKNVWILRIRIQIRIRNTAYLRSLIFSVSFFMAAQEEVAASGVESDEEEPAHKRHRAQPCPACLGVLQDAYMMPRYVKTKRQDFKN